MNNPHYTLTVLNRLADRRPEQSVRLEEALRGRIEELAVVCLDVSVETEGPLGQVLARLVEERPSSALVGRLLEACDQPRLRNVIALREVAAVAARQHLIGLAGKLPLRPAPDQLVDLAVAYCRFGGRLTDCGDWHGALLHHQEAAEIWRRIAPLTPGVDLEPQAMNLTMLIKVHGLLGRWQEAASACEEALPIWRSLARAQTHEHLNGLAITLLRYGNVLAELRRAEDALAANREARELFEGLAARQPSAYQPGLASSLVNLARRLAEGGRLREAREYLEEAIRIRRTLAAEQPETFRPDLALALHNRGALAEDLDRWEDAYEASREAVRLRRELVKERREAFLADLAGSLRNLGTELAELGRLEEALVLNEDAIAAFRELTPRSPPRFVPQLAKLHVRRCGLLSDLDRQADLLRAAEGGLRDLGAHLPLCQGEMRTYLGMLYGFYLESSASTGRPRDEKLVRRVADALAGRAQLANDPDRSPGAAP